MARVVRVALEADTRAAHRPRADPPHELIDRLAALVAPVSPARGLPTEEPVFDWKRLRLANVRPKGYACWPTARARPRPWCMSPVLAHGPRRIPRRS